MPDDRWFEVDRQGLAENLSDDDRVRLVLELVQNAWDADGVTEVAIELAYLDRALWRLDVRDDAPDGFADLTHAYRLYARSTKRNDPTKRGRFNEGEKKVLALCKRAVVRTTTGVAVFEEDGTRGSFGTPTESGSVFQGEIRLTKPQGERALALLRTLIPPPEITTTINGEKLAGRTPFLTFDAVLPTVIYDDDGNASSTRRTATVSLYEPDVAETPTVYELGLPVVEYADRWHADVAQKVPLNRDRNALPPAFLRRLRAEIANRAHFLLDANETAKPWVSEAMRAPEIESEAVRSIVKTRFGEKAVVFDPSDREANDLAASQGYMVVPPRTFDREVWKKVREADALLPAGQVTPSPGVAFGSEGEGPISGDAWTPGMVRVARYAETLAGALLDREIQVSIYRRLSSRNGSRVAACYSPGALSFNLAGLGNRWFDEPDEKEIDALLLHEFAHDRVSNHYDARFADEIARLGAALRHVDVKLEGSDL